jgi:ABC-2 type transport system permease protein
MRNTYLIAKREYLERIRTRAFMVMTVLIPALMGGSLYLPALFIGRHAQESKHMVVVASDQSSGEVIAHELKVAKDEALKQKDEALKQTALSKPGLAQVPASRLEIEVDTNSSELNRAALAAKVDRKQLDGVIWATNDALASKHILFITRDVSSFEENIEIQGSVSKAVQRDILKSKGLSDAEIENAQARVQLETQSPSGKPAGNFQSTILPMLFMIMVLYMSVLLYGINVMNAVLEEKASRVMEVVLASAKPTELMAGKVLGVGAVGLTQIAIWVAAGALLPGVMGGNLDVTKIIAGKVVVFFVIFFVLGYLLYSSLYAAIGAMCNSQQEAQQISQLVTLPLVLPLFLIGYILQYPGSPIAVVASMFPLSSPLIMFTRIAMDKEPLMKMWDQIAAAIAIDVLTIYLIILLCAKIYRVGILMYGKRPTMPEIMKWLKYA